VDRATVTATLEDADRTVTSIDAGSADVVGLSALLISREVAPEEALLVEERAQFLRHAVAALPERMAYIVTAIYFQDRSVKEVAVELGLTHSAVSQQRSEAMRLLRDGVETHYAAEPVADGVTAHSRVARKRREQYLATLAGVAAGGITRAAAAVAGQAAVVVEQAAVAAEHAGAVTQKALGVSA
jgi:RNA polymerase sigma factor for flagellar operon FliA